MAWPCGFFHYTTNTSSVVAAVIGSPLSGYNYWQLIHQDVHNATLCYNHSPITIAIYRFILLDLMEIAAHLMIAFTCKLVSIMSCSVANSVHARFILNDGMVRYTIYNYYYALFMPMQLTLSV